MTPKLNCENVTDTRGQAYGQTYPEEYCAWDLRSSCGSGSNTAGDSVVTAARHGWRRICLARPSSREYRILLRVYGALVGRAEEKLRKVAN